MAQQSTHQRMFLKLKVHHLSYYMISLFSMVNKPYCLSVEYVMENYIDTPSQTTANKLDDRSARAKFTSTLQLTKLKEEHSEDFHIRVVKNNSFQVGQNNEPSQSITYHKDIQSFTDMFEVLSFNIHRILNINKDLENLKIEKKQSKKKTIVHSNYQNYNQTIVKPLVDYKGKAKHLEKQRKDCKRTIREIMKELYSC